MTENIAQPRHEGDNPFMPSTEKETSADSQPVEKKEDGTETQAPDGDKTNNRADNTVPFNEHPRWLEREDDWKKRFDSQESRHQEDLKKIREEFGQQRKDNAGQNKIPTWFGGDQESWDAYRNDRDAELTAAEERAYKRVAEERSQKEEQQEKLQKEADTHMQTELSAIESDKALNPTGGKIDANKFLKYVVDNEFVDYKTQKWDYRKAWKFYQLETAPKGTDNKERKHLAGATTSDSKGESKQKEFKTNKDFQRKKPW